MTKAPLHDAAGLAEDCGGIRSLADRLTEKLIGFVDLGPDTNNGAVAKEMPLHIRALLHKIADEIGVEGSAILAEYVFAVLVALDSLSEDFSEVIEHLKRLRAYSKAEIARSGKASPDIARQRRDKLRPHVQKVLAENPGMDATRVRKALIRLPPADRPAELRLVQRTQQKADIEAIIGELRLPKSHPA